MNPIRFFIVGTVLYTSFAAASSEIATIKISGTMKKIIGTFSTYGHPRPDDTFELDLSDLPKDRLQLVRPKFDKARDVSPYIPLQTPFLIDKIEEKKHELEQNYIWLLSKSGSSKLLIQMSMPTLDKGAQVRIYFYEEYDKHRIGCMAEAEGVIR